MHRRTLLKTATIAAGGILAQSCLPFKHITGWIPAALKQRTDFAEETALKFAFTVVPAYDIIDSKVVDPLWDPFYSFDEYCPLFLDLLHTTADDLYSKSFTSLNHDQCTRVVSSILNDGCTGADLVNGALLAIHCSFYSGFADADKGCPTIGFNGRSGVGQGLPSIVPDLRGPTTPTSLTAIN